MTSRTRSPEEWISFLLTVIENIPGKPDWNQVALDTGAYKSGKFANQAYSNLRKKYGLLEAHDGSSSVPATPKSSNKRAAGTNKSDDDEVKPKRARKTTAPKTKTPKKSSLAQDESDDEKPQTIKAEDSDEDELNGNATVKDDEDEEAEEQD